MPRDYQLISADSHVLEPPHLWTTYMAKKFHDKVPRVVPDGEGGEAWQFAPDVPPAPIGIYASAGRKHEDVRWTGRHVRRGEPGQLPRRAAPRGAGHRRRRRRGALRLGAHDEPLLLRPRSRVPPRRRAGLQQLARRGVRERRSVAPDRPRRASRRSASRRRSARWSAVSKLGFRGVWLNTMPSVGADDPSRGRPVLGGGAGRRRRRCTSTCASCARSTSRSRRACAATT